MANKLPKAMLNGKEVNACSLCGQGCNTSAWNKWKMCRECHKLVQQGLDKERVKRIRASEISGKALTKSDEEQVITSYKKHNIYNFKTTHPPGIRIILRNNEEAKYVQEVYSYYSHYGENVPEFNVLISSILQAKLDLFRSSKDMADEDLPYNERKGLKEIDIKLGDQINKTTRVLEDLKDRIDSQSGNILTAKFSSMLKYLHDNEQEYMGIGICDTCAKRVIFKTNFPTFKTYMLELLDELQLVSGRERLSKNTVDYVINFITSHLDDMSLSKTYTIEHTRELESSMIDGGKF